MLPLRLAVVTSCSSFESNFSPHSLQPLFRNSSISILLHNLWKRTNFSLIIDLRCWNTCLHQTVICYQTTIQILDQSYLCRWKPCLETLRWRLQWRNSNAIYLFINYASEAAHVTLQTYKIKHTVKTQRIKISKNIIHNRETKFRYQQSEQIHSMVPSWWYFLRQKTHQYRIYYTVLEIHDNSLQTLSVIQYYLNDDSSSIKLIYVGLARDKMVMIYKRTAATWKNSTKRVVPSSVKFMQTAITQGPCLATVH